MMNFKDVYKGILSVFSYPNIPEELLEDGVGPILLHISDTPIDIYNDIFKLIDILKPSYIIHTGDMADNIKLEFQQNRMPSYYMAVKSFIEGLEKSDSEIYYVMGNHDDYDTVNKLIDKGSILEDGQINICGYRIAVGHYYKEYSGGIDFNLYGHSFEPKHFQKDGSLGLNGVLNINVIDLSNKKVYHLGYPVGTNRSRGMETKKIGL